VRSDVTRAIGEIASGSSMPLWQHKVRHYQALKTLSRAFVICAVMTMAWGKFYKEPPFVFSADLSSDIGYFEAIKRPMMRRVFEPIIVFNVSENVEMLILALEVDQILGGKGFFRTTNRRLWSPNSVSLNDSISVCESELRVNGVVWRIEIYEEVEIFCLECFLRS
jgi:hypothetical protein